MAEQPATTPTDARGSGSVTSLDGAAQITLPKGGGAIRAIGDKFSTNLANGTGGLTVPIPLSPSRSGFGPKLSLSYDSGSGNGPFGVGWSLSLPAITRKTDKGLPRYEDAEESDVFILSGAEDLVPVLKRDGERGWVFDEFERDGYRVKRYRPRVEGLFARIERWTRIETSEVHWRSLARDNVLTVYGFDAGSRIFDPEHPDHVFSWLICRTYDDKGNAVVYDYATENSDGVDTTKPNERRRTRTANHYLRRVRYGNRVPLLVDPDIPSARSPHLKPQDFDLAQWMFEVVFDYGGGHYREEPADKDGHILATASTGGSGSWQVRRDPFSSYRSGFEIRTYRLCRRVLMFHHFPDELGTESYLVRSMALVYNEKPIGSFLTRIAQSGHKRRECNRYLTRSLPPLDLSYSASPLEDPDFGDFRLDDVCSVSLANLPGGIDGDMYRWLDLDGEGISGVLTEQANAWFYKPNLGNGRFGATELVKSRPSLAALNGGAQLLMDVAGDGNLDLVDLSPGVAGFQERTLDGGWQGFRAFRSLPVRDWRDPNLRFVDVTGDGVADVLVTEDDVLIWHPSWLEDGFGPGVYVHVPQEEKMGPRIVFADGTQSIYLADMSGDGLADIVRIRNDQICYWPNLGYGRFGARVTMDNAPRFEEPDTFDQSRIRLADTDGSGTSDVLYWGRDGIRIFLNETGKGWSSARHLRQFPAVDDVGLISVTDFLGHGTACIVWSSPLPREAGRQIRYVDLMRGQKPHLLTRAVNNVGAETAIEYASSTEFYLADKAAGTPWVTKLPFPVHVVKRVKTYDFMSRNQFVTRYSYHHGFYDGVEREFRGFGRVDQIDTEELATLSANGTFPTGDNIDAASNVPPVLTRTWFHTGVYLHGGRVSRHMADEYYLEGLGRSGETRLSYDQIQALLLDDSILPDDLSPEEAREACRSLTGALLRQEVYALDRTEESSRPYTVAESNFTICMLQPRLTNRHAVFFTHGRESLSFNYERKLYEIDGRRCADPRVLHGVTLNVDDYGNVLKSAAIGYGRRHSEASPLLTDADHQRQAQILVTITENEYTNAVKSADAYRAPLLSQSRLYELLNVRPVANWSNITNLFHYSELADIAMRASDGAHDLLFEDWRGTGAIDDAPYRRLVKQSRTLYRSNRLDRLLPLGFMESLALPGESYKLAFTPSLLASTYSRVIGNQPPDDLLPEPVAVLASRGPDGGGYVDLDHDNRWWLPSGRLFYSPSPDDQPQAELSYARQHFFLPHRNVDTFGNTSTLAFDSHQLALVETRDPVGNTVKAETDYRVLAPKLVTDANGNRSAAAFDALGMLAGTAVMGKEGENLGDSLEGFVADLTDDTILEHINNPLDDPQQILGNATARMLYDVFAYERTRSEAQPRPVVTYTLARETHASDLAPGQITKIQHSFSYSDGFGREIQKKIQAEPGAVVEGGPVNNSRWVGSGWIIFNNKGKPVREYEPFFSPTHAFEFAQLVGVSPIILYDPVERGVATAHPNHTYEKVVFDPWHQDIWDVNDTVLQTDPTTDPDVGGLFRRLPAADYAPTWYSQRADGNLGPQEQEAARKAAAHANTPAIAYFDTLGRTFLTVADNAAGGKYATRVELDILGNQRSVTDALGRQVMNYDYDMLGNRIHYASMDEGDRWMLNDSAGKAIRAWDSRGHNFRTAYDVLRRPTGQFVLGTDPDNSDPRTLHGEALYEKVEYGEGQPDAQALNLRTRIFQHFDTAGVVINSGHNSVTNKEEAYDFKGNLLRTRRQFLQDYKALADWSKTPPAFQEEVFTSSSQFDALNRQVNATTPDGSTFHPIYNEANLLESVSVNVLSATAATPFVTNIDYNAKGQRVLIEFGNGVKTTYDYDPLTFRLAHLLTQRDAAVFPGDCPSPPVATWPGCQVQNLTYTYDPAGNITHIHDDAQQLIYFRNRRVEPSSDFTYDAIYRVIRAAGREHLGLGSGGQPLPPTATSYNDVPRVNLAHPNDGNAMGLYAEHYHYDSVGNLLQLKHRGTNPCNPGWTRTYTYNETSLLQSGNASNRLTRTTVNGAQPLHENYTHDAHGNMSAMPQLHLMHWDFGDRLHVTQRQAVNASDIDGTQHQGEQTYYVYDAAGQRVRKVTESANGERRKERNYLLGYEQYREFDGGGSTVTLERQTLHVMDDERRVALVETEMTGPTAATHSSAATTTRYQFGNHLGSACLELDQNAAVISYEEYYPYGSTSYQAGRTVAEVRLKRYRYIAKERDEESGLAYHGARYYAPWLGRWTAPDPAGLVDGTNLYAYVKDNPVVHVDVAGKQAGPYQSYVGVMQAANAAQDLANDVGAPGFGESLIPVWGSGRQAIHSFQTGHWVWGTVHTALAVSDVFLVKSLVTAGGKIVLKGVAKLGADEAAELAAKEAAAKAAAEQAAKEAAEKEAAAKAAAEQAAKEAAAKEAAEQAAKDAAAKEAAEKAAAEQATKEAAAKEAAEQAAKDAAGKAAAEQAGKEAAAKEATEQAAKDAAAQAAGTARTYVYRSVVDGKVIYVGITNNLARRAAEHLASKGIRISQLMVTATRADARAVEQALIEIHRLGKEGTLLNKINSIAKSNPIYAKQLQRGYELLHSIGY